MVKFCGKLEGKGP